MFIVMTGHVAECNGVAHSSISGQLWRSITQGSKSSKQSRLVQSRFVNDNVICKMSYFV